MFLFIINQQQKNMKKSFYQQKSDIQSSQSSSSSDDEVSDVSKPSRKQKRSTTVVPRFIKNAIEEIDTNVIVINISKTQYEVVEAVAKQLGWQIQRSRKSQKWDVMWIDSHIEAHDLFKLNEHQKISHYPSIYVLTRKNFLGKSLMKMGKIFPQQYNFFPSTWTLPCEYNQLVRYDQNLEKKQIYIFKPENLAQGKGIKLTERIEDFVGKTGIVQVYVNDPLLIEGLKFDLRIYVLILGYDPLRIFIYDEGLGRFATENYEKARKKNMRDVHMHLTNYAINKTNNKFIYNKSVKDMNTGHKRSLTAIYNYLNKMGVDVQELKEKIDEVIIKTLLVGQPMIAHTYGLAQADNSNDLCFQILGFDILINEKLQPILLQVNHTPSFKTDTPLDLYIKKGLIKDTLNLLNVNTDKKKQKIDKKKQFLELRSQRKLIKLSNQQKQAQRIENQKERTEYQQRNLGNFRKIFPHPDIERFKDIIKNTSKIFNEYNGFKNKNTSRFSYGNTRPNSNECSPLKIKNEKLKSLSKYNKTVQLKKEFQQNQQTKFPSLAFGKQKDKLRNYSGYIGKMKEQIKPELVISEKKIQHLPDPQELRINLLEKELANKGNFVAPKILDMGSISNKMTFQKQSSISSIILNSPMLDLGVMAKTDPTIKLKLNSASKASMKKQKNFEEVVSETTNTLLGLQVCKKVTYETILQTLKKKQRKEKYSSKILPKKKY